MVILKDYSSQPSCEVELNLKFVNDESIKFSVHFRSGPAFPVVYSEMQCLIRDFLKLLDDLLKIDYKSLHILEPHDPGLCIYHIPEPGRGLDEPLYKLFFVLDAGEKNNFLATECGPALCIIVKMEQIIEFVSSLKSEIDSFRTKENH